MYILLKEKLNNWPEFRVHVGSCGLYEDKQHVVNFELI